jgi:peptidyl-prolyl cis-trans isomerase SurA|tara:strand:- start:424 stop:1359 length:936 start_codon:yes stop_codon:yes gene_type:complete
MLFKKILILISLALTTFIQIANSYENRIILKIDREIVTNLDIKNEARYLSALNPKLMELNEDKIFDISKNSVIRENIKKIEILKNTKDFEVSNDFLEKIIQSRYKSLGLNSKNEFINYLENFNIKIDTVVKKIKIEALWNQLIFFKFSKNIKINKEKLKKDIEKNTNLNETRQFLLKEILFDVKESSNLDKKYDQIKKSISETGFENTASIYSISDTAKVGGLLGWIDENSLNSKIKNSLLGLKLNEYSKPIILTGGFLILQISDIKVIKEKLDIDKELANAINAETNRQLNQFSNIYFNKIKKEVSINEK